MAGQDVVSLYEQIADWFLARRDGKGPLMEENFLKAVDEVLPEKAEILDLGCGAGEPIAGYFIRAGKRVTGVDGAARLLAKSRERFPGMRWLLADMRGLDLGRTYDAVIAWDSFFHLDYDDQRAMFPVFARHLAPGGLLLFTSGPDHGEAHGVMDGVNFAHYSLSQGEYRGLLKTAGCAVLLHAVEDPHCGGHTVWLAKKEGEAAGPAPAGRL